ncbi:hypothetical protein AB0J83_06385 [Actinoplanes sp. NPDC049596]|uniref:hypothetical protein n=1 Tax=unclassified Actinoplanes TaxID=2626549 RepID=UPI003416DB28
MTYSLPASDVALLTAAALDAHPSAGRFVALAVGPHDPMAAVARTVERQVFEQSFGNDADEMAAEYGPYEQNSLFFLVLDRRTGMPAGAGRVIDGGGKTLDEAPDLIGQDLSEIVATHGMHDGKIWDFATVGVLPAYRGGKSGLAVSSLLYRTFLKAGHRAGVRHLVALLDHRAHRNLALLGVPFVPMANSAPFAYLGSPSTMALHVPFADIEPSLTRQSRLLRRPGAPFSGEIRARGLRRLLIRRLGARISHQVSTGAGLDPHITLPGLERRRSLTKHA